MRENADGLQVFRKLGPHYASDDITVLSKIMQQAIGYFIIEEPVS